jgi:serine/threonine protein kinase/dipeptidyl aminopeptidase/acylaminoacyl peptidase
MAVGGTTQPQRVIQFGPFELNVRTAELRKHGTRIRLHEQPFRILLMLLEHPGEAVLREEIRKTLWPNDTVVEFDHSINAAIQRLRDALGDSADNPRYVETLARRGYRFIGTVESAEPEPAAPASIDPGDLAGRTFSHFDVLEKVGSGGMGVVYRAEDTSLGRQVALKFLPMPAEEATPQMRERFQREARAASSLNHPNICTIYGVEEFAGQPVIEMELLDGETLESRLAKGALTADKALPLAMQLASALDAAHRKGIVHRDLKPANIMLTAQSSGTAVKVLDFGLAKMARAPSAADATATAISQVGTVLGTWHYMSPEQVQGQEADARSDIFSFGLVLYEMLAGRRAFQGGTSVEVMNAILKEDPPGLPEAAPAGLRQVVADCLEKDPEARFESARDLLFALRALAAGPASGVALRATARTRRKRWLFPVIAAAFAALSVAMYFSRPEPLDLSKYRFTPVVAEAEPADYSSWSPDGKSITCMQSVNGPWQVMLRSLASPTPTQLTRMEAGVDHSSAPFFAKDGEQVYFIAGGDLWTVAAVGGEPRVLFKQMREPILAPALSPDGKTLALWQSTKDDDGKTYHTSVWISSPPGAPPRRYQPAPFRIQGGYRPNVFRFSPDGSRIVLSSDRVAGEAMVWTLPWPDGPNAKPRQLLAKHAFSVVPGVDWMADSRHLLLSTDGRLWLGDPETGSLRQMTASASEYAANPSVAPDGNRVLFTVDRSEHDIVEVPLDGSPARPLSATSRDEMSPSWSAAGGVMAYITDRSGETEIWLRSPDGNWERPAVRQSDFPDDPGKDFHTVAISPDGRRLAYTRHDRIWISPVSGGRPLPAVGGETLLAAPSWSPDSTSIAFMGSNFSIAVTRIGSERPPLLFPDTAHICWSPPVWSPDGRWIACATNQQTVLLVSPDGKERRSLPSPARISYVYSGLVWSRDSNTIYLATSRSPGSRLDALDVRSGKSHQIADYGQSLVFNGGYTYALTGSLMRDGKSFATTVINLRSELWMLEGFPRPRRGWF